MGTIKIRRKVSKLGISFCMTRSDLLAKYQIIRLETNQFLRGWQAKNPMKPNFLGDI